MIKRKSVETAEKPKAGQAWFINKGGTFRMGVEESGRVRRIIKPNEKFLAKVSEIPKAFRDHIIPLSQSAYVEAGGEPTEKKVPELGYQIKQRSSGDLFDIVDSNGKPVNEKGLSEETAKELLAKLME